MNIKRTWIVASATIAVAGFAGAGIAMANDDVELRDRQPVPTVELKGDPGGVQPARASVDSGASAYSATSDSPDEPGYRAPAPPPKAAADSGNSPAPAPVKPAPVRAADSGNSPNRVADSGNSPAPAPARGADSGNSPAPAPARGADSGDSPAPAPAGGANSGNSAASADSGD
ncbi:MAG TPA: hypothetical protein VHH15_00595 [Actinophytocola sp.]|nr:hypothetical protein [Actinophytocola sp.]